MRHYIYNVLLGLALLTTGTAMAADKKPAKPTVELQGTVTDAATGKPMAGVMIEAFGDRKYSAMTDETGRYTIKVPQGTGSLKMKVEGYNMQQVPVGKGDADIDARLYSNAFAEDYTATAAQSQREAKRFDNNAELSADQLIARQLGGDIRMVSRGGNPGVGDMMLIGGINSLSANAQPLVVIDGVIMDMQYSRQMLHQGYYNNLLANINVNDIESVQVLKNGTAIYGAKGANGVLLINTKRNKSMATRIDVNVGGSFLMKPRTADVLGAEDYRLYTTALVAGRVKDMGTLDYLKTDPTYYYYPKYHNSTDWKDEVLHNTWAQTYGINVQGGDAVANYNLSVGYSQANSVLHGNDMNRFDMRLNTDISVLRGFDIRFDAAYSDVNRTLMDDGAPADMSTGIITSPGMLALVKAPFLSPYAHDINGNVSGFLAEADDYMSQVYGSDVSVANPSAILKYGDGTNRNSFGNRLIMLAITPKVRIGRHVTISEHFSFNLVNTNENYYLPLEGVPSFKDNSISISSYQKNIVRSMAARQINIQSDTRATWTNQFGAHGINLFGGWRYVSSNYKLTKMTGYNSGNDKTPSISSTTGRRLNAGVDDKVREITAYAQAEYNYAQRYYATAGLSAQSSSRFGDEADGGMKLFGVKWGLFPSIQAAWVMTNESWFPRLKGINYLRINASMDWTGNDDISAIASRTYFVANNMLAGAVDGKSIGNIGNDKLAWETTRRLTLGIEGNFIDNRLHVGFNYFKAWTSNLLTLHQLAWTSGMQENWGNDGKLQNEGFDVNITAKLLNLKDWKWEAGLSIGHYKNKVTALPDGNKAIENTIYGATVQTAVGQPVGVFYGYRTNGVISSTADAQKTNLYQVADNGERQYFAAGDMRFIDNNADGEIYADDRVQIGDPNPDIYGNIHTALAWKQWRLDATLNYSLGNDIYNYQRSILEGGNAYLNQTTAMARRWTTEGQQTDMPRVNYQDAMGNSRFSDRWIEDGSYIKLANVTLSYALPIRSTYLQGITVWAAADNLFTVTKYLGSDPEACALGGALYQGIDYGQLGMGRKFSMGVKINL